MRDTIWLDIKKKVVEQTLSLFKCLRVSGFLNLLCNFKNAALLTLMWSTDVKDRKLYSLYLFLVI